MDKDLYNGLIVEIVDSAIKGNIQRLKQVTQILIDILEESGEYRQAKRLDDVLNQRKKSNIVVAD